MELKHVVFKGHDRGRNTSRNIASICGIPFYCSSGVNSGFEGTWFPFRGISPYRQFLKCKDDQTLPKILNRISTHYLHKKIDSPQKSKLQMMH